MMAKQRAATNMEYFLIVLEYEALKYEVDTFPERWSLVDKAMQLLLSLFFKCLILIG